ncbi:MAG: response regulator [Clostridia bacterium]|jgi:CheY-like chemotaxis protein
MFKILIIVDSLPDYLVLKKALNKIKDIKIELIHKKNGQEGIDYILKKNEFSSCETPDIIILDLNLPIVNGFDVLKTIKENEIYKVLPIIIYSTSEEKDDILISYSLHANSYIVKTFDIHDLYEKVNIFAKYWFKETKIIK